MDIFSLESRLYKRVCPSVGPSVGPSFGPSVGNAFARRTDTRLRTTYFVYKYLFHGELILHYLHDSSLNVSHDYVKGYDGPSIPASVPWPVNNLLGGQRRTTYSIYATDLSFKVKVTHQT